jgi:hypothetical protein
MKLNKTVNTIIFIVINLMVSGVFYISHWLEESIYTIIVLVLWLVSLLLILPTVYAQTNKVTLYIDVLDHYDNTNSEDEFFKEFVDALKELSAYYKEWKESSVSPAINYTVYAVNILAAQVYTEAYVFYIALLYYTIVVFLRSLVLRLHYRLEEAISRNNL